MRVLVLNRLGERLAMRLRGVADLLVDGETVLPTALAPLPLAPTELVLVEPAYRPERRARTPVPECHRCRGRHLGRCR